MKYIIVHENGKVTDYRKTESEIAIGNIAVVDSIPKFEPREGFNGVLNYNTETGLFWDYEEAPAPEEPVYPYGLSDSQIEDVEQVYRDKVAEEVAADETATA